MKIKLLAALLAITVVCASTPLAFAHIIGDPAHDNAGVKYDFSVRPSTNIVRGATGTNIAAAFARFAPTVRTHSDGKFLYVESDGLPAHNMMVGITA